MRNEALADELLAIDSIYPGAISLSEGSDNTYTVQVPDTAVSFFLSFDTEYPDTRPRISAASGIDRAVLDQCLQDSAGGEVLLSLISVVQEHLESSSEQETSAARVSCEECAGTEHTLESSVDWTIGEPIHDRKSTMLGRACKVTSREELNAALRSIDQDKRLQKATHPRIWACRFTTPHGTLLQENDDDGETAAGSRLAFLLDVTEATDVLVVVSRWFGGVLLGDIRFKHISTAARDALDRGGFLTSHESSDQSKCAKKGKK